MDDIRQHIDEVAEDQRQYVLEALDRLINAIEDNTTKSEIVGAVEVIAEKSPKMMNRLKALLGRVAEKAGEVAVLKAIDYVMQSASGS
ncbi:MAG: hypothetical protein IRY99_07905 [Isosphaeraceae bacterium]|nr:hypothetical protein [Isosphaeraceae bacterium]